MYSAVCRSVPPDCCTKLSTFEQCTNAALAKLANDKIDRCVYAARIDQVDADFANINKALAEQAVQVDRLIPADAERTSEVDGDEEEGEGEEEDEEEDDDADGSWLNT